MHAADKTHLKVNVKLFFLDVLSNIVNNLTTLSIIALIIKSVISNNIADIPLFSSLLVASQRLNSSAWNLSYQLTQLSRVSKYTNRTLAHLAPGNRQADTTPGTGTQSA